MFVHHVYFWLKNPNRKEDLAALKVGLEALKQGIEPKILAHIGVPAPTDRDVIDRSYALSWLMLFATPQDQDVYQDHPVHKKFVEDCSHLWEKVIVYDSI
jgi:hypothetical protein